jgi:hypothetical protein
MRWKLSILPIVLNEVFSFDWSVDEEYQRWVNKYLVEDE